MTNEEFIKILKEDQFFEDFREHALHRYPVVKYYLKHYPTVVSNGVTTMDT